MMKIDAATFTSDSKKETFRDFIHQLALENNKAVQIGAVKCFLFVVYDQRNPYFRKMFDDQVFWEALDKDTGEHLAVIAYRENHYVPSNPNMVRMMLKTASGFDDLYSHFFKSVLNINISTSKFPLLVAVALDGGSSTLDIAELKVSTVDSAYNYFADIVRCLASTLNETDVKFLNNPSEVLDIVRTALAGKVTWLNLKQQYQFAQGFFPIFKWARYLVGM